jgi:cytochrome c oxidase accessory protein FixG
VLLDGNSLIVSYDPKRGEPRHHAHVPSDSSTSETHKAQAGGDCVDCKLCVETCPTGIDIRDGLRMECLGCAQCIDACDAVMTKLKRPTGLIRYSSQLRIAGEPGRMARPRLFIYSGVLLLIAGVFTALVSQAKSTDVTLLRGMGVPFTELAGGEVANPVRLKITNRTHEPRTYRLEVIEGGPARILSEELPVIVQPTASVTRGLVIAVPASSFLMGKHKVRLRILDDHQTGIEVNYDMLGPYSISTTSASGVMPRASQ